eukprot:scaffold162915_cov19-Prasinocladus_malaysianus.AAC.2
MIYTWPTNPSLTATLSATAALPLSALTAIQRSSHGETRTITLRLGLSDSTYHRVRYCTDSNGHEIGDKFKNKYQALATAIQQAGQWQGTIDI